MRTVTANGATMPAIGLGTWQLRDEQCAEIVEHALRVGYRHIDTAEMYANEIEVGQGIRASGISRDDIFVTTKIWPDNFAADAFARAVDERLRLLDVGPVDLLLLHWPSRVVPVAETIAALNRAREQGLTRHIGISNFTPAMVNEAVALSQAPLVCNQVEYHPLLNQDAVLAACRSHGMAVTAYCPIARGEVMDEPVMCEIAREHGVTPAQLSLAWLVHQEGVVAIPRSSQPGRVEENLAAMDIELNRQEVDRISGLTSRNRRLVSPDGVAPDWNA